MSQYLLASRRLTFAFSIVTMAVLAACGGGNGADPATPDVAGAALFGSSSATAQSDSVSVDSLAASTADGEPAEGSAGMATASAVRRVSLSDIGTALAKAGVDVETTKLGAALVLENIKSTKATSGLLPAINMLKVPAKVAGHPTDQVQATTEIAPDSDIGAFRTTCDFSHMSFDDPLALPGQPGKSHLHVFFGNTGTNAYSTSASLASTGNSTCRGGTVNRTAYWVPALIDTKDGSPIKPDSLSVYYKTGYNGVQPKDVHPFPVGLRILAGIPNATTDTSSVEFSGYWSCDGGNYARGKSIPDCLPGDGHNLFFNFVFPQCWDGVNLDSPDHKSHMAYAAPWIPNGCPSTHPVAVPEITFLIWYAVPEPHAALRWRLSSDNYSSDLPGGYSIHADWMNGWKPDIMNAWVKNCDQASKDCHSHLLGDGRMIY